MALEKKKQASRESPVREKVTAETTSWDSAKLGGQAKKGGGKKWPDGFRAGNANEPQYSTRNLIGKGRAVLTGSLKLHLRACIRWKGTTKKTSSSPPNDKKI